MANEKDLLISFLVDMKVDVRDKAFSEYSLIRNSISLLTSKGGNYELRIRKLNAPSQFDEVSLKCTAPNMRYGCTCASIKRFKICTHIASTAIFILNRTHGVSFDKLNTIISDSEYEAVSNVNKAIIEEELAIPEPPIKETTKSSKSIPTFPGANELKSTPTTKKEINTSALSWKSFKSKPGAVFQTVQLLFFGSPSSLIIKNTRFVSIDRENVILRFEHKPEVGTHCNPLIRYDQDEQFYYACDCQDKVQMCYHVKAAFTVLEKENSKTYFDQFKDWDAEKKALLKPYGLKPGDKEVDDLVFKVDAYGKMTLRTPPWLWTNDITTQLEDFKKVLAPQKSNSNRPSLSINTTIDFEVGFLINLESSHFENGFDIDCIKVYRTDDGFKFNRLSIHQSATLPLLRELDNSTYDQLIKLSSDMAKRHLTTLGFIGLYDKSFHWARVGDDVRFALWQYYTKQVKMFWPYLCNSELVFINKKTNFIDSNINPIKCSPHPLELSFAVAEEGRYISITLNKTINGQAVGLGQGKIYKGFLFEFNDQFHITEDVEDFDLLKQFEYGFIKIPIGAKGQVIKTILPLLQKKHKIEIPESLKATLINAEPEFQVLLKELDGKFLVFQPQYVYDGQVVNYEPEPESILKPLADNTYAIIERKHEAEQAFFDSIKALHPKFDKAGGNNFFHLPFEDTMKKNWFLDTIAGLVENKVPVLGIQDLQKHRYNPHKPKWEMRTGSGLDWFDVSVRVSYGEQTIALKEVRKAMAENRKTVVLGDGTFGLLPDEWANQYGMLLKMGAEQKDGKLRVSKLHFTIIDELHGQVNNEAIIDEINEKKQKLQNIDSIKSVQPSQGIKANLRPYQLSGFQWLHALDELGWGGCLADDMGLGKTLQAITFLQYLKEKYTGTTHLVICPTSLIYNWENELKKFAPGIKYHIYYGNEREISSAHFEAYDLVITSYGIIRNDLRELVQFDWHYIILDESQAIKNPDSQTNKALQVLKSRNRIILSGTPIQNNTYDLYAQFNFINPGLLGNREFFKTEFANPIDKNNDAVKGGQLRRLIFPFMLRRTKAQVAKDLPDKTETILWCEMGKEQRAAYDSYKEYYRVMLLDKIETQGLAKSGLFIIEGLLRLRQICDSPVMVKDNTVTTKQSIKLDELIREVEENAGGHKLLVFSQFTEMLHLIEDRLKIDKIDYAYLDGSTSADKRNEQVQKFQEDPNLRVFLISLKAGGVGLNLTAADYVYIVDPWWNPAVEQQAIDRTHRIGQVNKIFAYKMICKDTVEEKIIQLQQKKKQLADDLVTEDAGFIKKLTRDDVAFLFS